MKNRINPLIALILWTALFSPGRAAGHLDITDTIRIEEVVVTGSPVKVNRSNIPMAVSVVDRSQIELSDESALLPILNGKVPGLFVTERGVTGFGVAAGSAGQISVRGVGGSPTTGVLMLIDGHPQFMGIMGHPLPDSYVASDAERVEVIRGPASILYGSNAMGGVINIITRKQSSEGLNGNARLSYGSFHTRKYQGSLGYKKDKFTVFASGNHDNTNGHRENSDFRISNGYVKVGYDITPGLYLHTDVSLAGFEAADPGPDTLNASPGERIDILRGYWALALRNEFEKLSGEIKLFYNFGEHDITDGFHSNDRNYGINFYESFQFIPGNNLTAGVDHMRYGGMAENVLAMKGQGIVFADTAVYETGLYGFVQQTFRGNFILNAGLRHQNHSVYGRQWIPSAGFAWQLGSGASWKGNVSKGFRSPTIRELFMWSPNPELDPETVINYETGISGAFFRGRMNTELTLFSVHGDNLIINVPMQGLRNAGEFTNRGIELLVNGRPARNLNLEGTYSYIHMKSPVFATPEHHLYLSAAYQWKKLLFTGSLQQIINLDNDPSPVVMSEDYTLVKARVTYSVNKYLKWYVSGDNLLNEDYEVNRYYTMPGATVFTGIQLAF